MIQRDELPAEGGGPSRNRDADLEWRTHEIARRLGADPQRGDADALRREAAAIEAILELRAERRAPRAAEIEPEVAEAARRAFCKPLARRSPGGDPRWSR
jgi:hypothetical protein